ncbi:MAG: VWA domain-containing protein [Actinomycetota bacterium]|nr:VWA domain-containing protein [Actinomycetota bacterium]
MGFAQALRAAGLTVGSGNVHTYCQAAAHLDIGDANDLYWAGRACLVSRSEDISTYDREFQRYFSRGRSRTAISVSGAVPRLSPTLLAGADALRQLATGTAHQASTGLRASDAQILRSKRFADCTPEELAAVFAVMERLRLSPPLRRSRRSRPSGRGRQYDWRRTIRRSLRTQGELVAEYRRAPRVRPRRLVLFLDVSGSMAGYSRALLQFSHSATRADSRTEVFCFGTRVTRITKQLRQRRPDRALAEAAEAVVDWEGGTRIGESLGTFLRTWGRRGLARGAVMVICSDGLERGDPGVLRAEMVRLRRLAHRIIWVNPLKADLAYQPQARGMRVALPFVDVFVSGHNLSSLEALALTLAEATVTR